MTFRRHWIASLLASALLAACGGGEPVVPGAGSPAGAPTTKGSFKALVVFGDDLSDVGTYAPATSLAGNGAAPYLGGKFTTNGATGTVWVENLAAALGIVVTPAEVGFAGSSVKCPAAANPALAGTCTGYAQGGAKVTDPNGPGRPGGALTVPLKTQIANHLARFGSFRDSDLVHLFGGNNDVLVVFEGFVGKAIQVQTDAATGKVTPEQASNLLLAAQLAAQAEVKRAALELAGYVGSEIVAKGGRYVAVWNLPDSAATPFGATLPAAVRPVLTTLVDTFNLWLRDGLTGMPVQIVDVNAQFREIAANPAKYGLANIAVPTCDADKIRLITGGRIGDGSSLFCNSTAGAPFNGMRTGASDRTWLWADGLHPTTGGHKVLSDFVLQVLKSYGWI